MTRKDKDNDKNNDKDNDKPITMTMTSQRTLRASSSFPEQGGRAAEPKDIKSVVVIPRAGWARGRAKGH
jgi:hypothetical protein